MRSLLCSLALFTASAQAGVYLEMSHADLQRPGGATTVSKFWAQDGRARSESGAADGQYMIFRDQKMFFVEPKQRRYRVMDKATVDELGDRMADMRRQMEARMAQLPAEQRAAMQRMMGGALHQGPAPERKAKATSRNEQVGGRSCRIWEIYEGPARDSELCVVPPGSLPAGDEFFAVMKDMSRMMEGMLKGVGGQGAQRNSFRDLERVKGIPILNRSFLNGIAAHETRMNVLREESVPATAFEVPAGYKPVPMVPATGPGRSGK